LHAERREKKKVRKKSRKQQKSEEGEIYMYILEGKSITQGERGEMANEETRPAGGVQKTSTSSEKDVH